MNARLPMLPDEHSAWLAATINRNQALYAGWSMVLDDDKDDADEGDDKDDADADKTGGDEGDDEKDWKAEFEAQQRVNRSLERKARKDAAVIKRLTGEKPKGGGKSDDKDDAQPDVEKIRAEAKAEAEHEVLLGRVEDKIEAKARAFVDPEDAVAVLLRSHNIEDFLDDGSIDVEAIADALKELGEKKPHLLAQGGKRFGGDADQGARKGSKGRPKSLGDAVTQHYSQR